MTLCNDRCCPAYPVDNNLVIAPPAAFRIAYNLDYHSDMFSTIVKWKLYQSQPRISFRINFELLSFIPENFYFINSEKYGYDWK